MAQRTQPGLSKDDKKKLISQFTTGMSTLVMFTGVKKLFNNWFTNTSGELIFGVGLIAFIAVLYYNLDH